MRTPGSKGEKTWALIQATGIRLLYERGYEGMNLRMLAKECGLTAGSLYNYISTKEDFVATLISDTMSELLDDLTAAHPPLSSPVDQIKNYVKIMVLWSTKRKEHSLVLLFESRMLSAQHQEAYSVLRRKFNNHIFSIVDNGMSAHAFEAVDSRIAANAISSMLMNIPLWYKDNGKWGVGEITKKYTALILSMLKAA